MKILVKLKSYQNIRVVNIIEQWTVRKETRMAHQFVARDIHAKSVINSRKVLEIVQGD